MEILDVRETLETIDQIEAVQCLDPSTEFDPEGYLSLLLLCRHHIQCQY